MVAADVPSALQLSMQAGWNQTPGDWSRMLNLEPHGCLVAEVAGAVVGTTVCCTFEEIAWLAMVLVDVSFRDRGIGRRLVQAGLKYADDAGVRTVRLDATPLGRPVYERLGFQPQFELSRWGGISAGCDLAATTGREATADDLQSIFEFDQRGTRTRRTKLVRRLCAESTPTVAINDKGHVAGFITRRLGRLSTQIGPCIGSLADAVSLLRRELEAHRGQPVIIDIPVDRIHLNAVAEQAGLTVQRSLLRMYRGEPVLENSALFQISSGAELG